jgi:hypothetical protein
VPVEAVSYFFCFLIEIAPLDDATAVVIRVGLFSSHLALIFYYKIVTKETITSRFQNFIRPWLIFFAIKKSGLLGPPLLVTCLQVTGEGLQRWPSSMATRPHSSQTNFIAASLSLHICLVSTWGAPQKLHRVLSPQGLHK